jgi:hemolysin D
LQAWVKLDKAALQVEDRSVNMTLGMAVTAEIATGRRRLVTYFLDPLEKATSESFRER